MALVNKEQAIAMYKGGMKQTDIANTFGVSRTAISNLIARTKANADVIDEFRANKAQIFEGIQSELLADVSTAPTKEKQALITSAAILEDKIRLERGQATVNTTVDIRMLIASLPDQSSNNAEPC